MGDEKNFGMLPEGPLGVIALDGCQALVQRWTTIWWSGEKPEERIIRSL